MAITRPWLTESDFKRILDLDFNTLESRLRTYVSRGKYKTITLPRKESATRLNIGFRRASRSETDLIYGSLLLNRREPVDAFPFLYRAHKGLPDSAEAAAWRGYLDIKRGRMDSGEKVARTIGGHETEYACALPPLCPSQPYGRESF